jgi:hypothetical protein
MTNFYPMTVTASPCGHTMLCRSQEQRDGFEESHCEDPCAATEFIEQWDGPLR